MTPDQARALVQGWDETGRQVEQQRWRELATLSAERALSASAALITAALSVPLPDSRRVSSGLVEQQRIFHRKRP